MNDKRYNPAIAARLRILVGGRQWVSLTQYLDGLSNAHFRTAGIMLGEVFMPELDDADFWALAQVLVSYNAKAFLVTVMKSWAGVAASRSLNPIPAFFFMLRGRDEDRRKTLQVLLPILNDYRLIEELLTAMDYRDVQLRINVFMRCLTPSTAFLLFKALCEVEDDRALLIRSTTYLMKQGDNLTFNLASLLRAFFGLEEVKGTFSLNLQPFQLSHLASDFNAFSKALAL